jgi:hypothetical protein
MNFLVFQRILWNELEPVNQATANDDEEWIKQRNKWMKENHIKTVFPGLMLFPMQNIVFETEEDELAFKLKYSQWTEWTE